MESVRNPEAAEREQRGRLRGGGPDQSAAVAGVAQPEGDLRCECWLHARGQPRGIVAAVPAADEARMSGQNGGGLALERSVQVDEEVGLLLGPLVHPVSSLRKLALTSSTARMLPVRIISSRAPTGRGRSRAGTGHGGRRKPLDPVTPSRDLRGERERGQRRPPG